MLSVQSTLYREKKEAGERSKWVGQRFLVPCRQIAREIHCRSQVLAGLVPNGP